MTKHDTHEITIQQFSMQGLTEDQSIHLSNDLRSIFHRAFGKDTWKEERILTLFNVWTDIFLGMAGDLPIAYCNVTLENYQSFGDYLWIESMAIDKIYQNSGLGYRMLKQALVTYSAVAWVGARTQNPSFIRLMQKICYPVFPFEDSYQNENGQKILNYSRRIIRECEKANQLGVCKAVYREGRLGDYPERPDLVEIYKTFATLDIDRENGDAVIVIGNKKNNNLI